MSNYTVKDMMIAYSEDALDLASQMGISLDYSEDSLKLLDEILEEYHLGLPKGIKKLFFRGPSEEDIVQMSKIWGGYLGEVIRRNIGGEWEMSKNFNNAISLTINNTEIYPPAKVNKRIINGKEDEVFFYYHAIKEDIVNV
ncbi:hypothetical protein J5Y03_11505 [Bacillus sp. RG28]|uniref:Uncharacterized protein n=1 Tax=Gottfriedia endophytica TaxID=2820819 RepID=A0A940NRQ6_9BACI|nr:hypothetical protein [Gottfriedia endophytica]MBP0725797.1 hypothetical protein [Gottfriedia endophytica]